MKKFMKFALCAAVALVFTSCGKSGKEAAQEAWDIMQEAQVLREEGDAAAAQQKMVDYQLLVSKYADDKEFLEEFAKIANEEINKMRPDTVQ